MIDKLFAELNFCHKFEKKENIFELFLRRSKFYYTLSNVVY